MNFWLPMDSDAVRACVVVLGVTLNSTTPLPLPAAPLTTMRNGSLLVAVHAQLLDVFTLTFPVPPNASKD